MDSLLLYLPVHILTGLYAAEQAYRYFRDEYTLIAPFPRTYFYTVGVLAGPITFAGNLFTFGSFLNPHRR